MTTDIEVRFTGELQKLKVEPGDLFILTMDREPTMEQVERLRAEFMRLLPGSMCLALGPGMTMGVHSVQSQLKSLIANEVGKAIAKRLGEERKKVQRLVKSAGGRQ